MTEHEHDTARLREDSIRPEHLKEGQKAAYENDINRMRRKKGEFVHVPCPACGDDNARSRFEKFTFAFVECAKCQTVFMNPRPTPAILADYYGNSENYRYWAKFIFPASEKARKEGLYRPRLERLKNICRSRGVRMGRLVEVGAGFGGFAEIVQESGAFDDVVVVEQTPELAESCRRRGLRVIEKRIEDAADEIGEADVVTAFEVIEHLYEPGAFFRSASNFLTRNGLLLVTCPNMLGFDIMLLGVLSDAIDFEHLNLFNPRSLSVLLEKSGFADIVTETPGRLDAELVRKAMLRGDYDPGNPFLTRVLIQDWDMIGERFQDFLAANNLSSHLWASAHRI